MQEQKHDNYVNGEWLPSAEYKDNISPSDLSDVIGSYAHAGQAEAEAAIKAAGIL